MNQTSLRINLIKSLLPPLAVATVLIGFFSLWSIYHEVDEVYDATLVQFSRTLSRFAASDTGQKAGTHIAHKYERNISYRIFRRGKLIAHSTDGADFSEVVPSAGFSDQAVEGEPWRFFTLIDEGTGYIVEVAEKYSIRSELTLQLLSGLVFPGIVFVLAAFAVIWWGVTRGLQRLTKLSSEVDRREADDLTPISDLSIPCEIQPLLDALNRLFLRISQSFSREREFTDNAAHELRTPLAAMKTQAQVILKTENLSSKGKEGFDNLLSSIDRAVEMTESLLSFARLQSDTTHKQAVDLGVLAEKEGASFGKLAAAKGLTIKTVIEKNALVDGVPHALEILVRNVIQNAVKFTPVDGVVTVGVKKDRGCVIFSVADTGSGISDELKPRVFDRFFRINKSVQAGSGLGLAMVKWIADVHGAKIALADNDPHGLVFSVSFISLHV